MYASPEMDAMVRNLGGGYLRVFAGHPPASVSDPLGELNAMLVELQFSDPAFEVSGVTATALPIPIALVTANGEPRFYRAYRADGLTAEWQGSVGIDGDLRLAFPILITSATMQIERFNVSLSTDPS